MKFKSDAYRKVRMTIRNREDKDGFCPQKDSFLTSIRYKFAFRDVIENIRDMIKEEDGVKYVYSKYDFIVNVRELQSLKNHICIVMDYVDFTAEIEELY